MDGVALLDCGKSFDPSTASIVGSCTKCGASIAFTVRASQICLGYIYSSGSAHFETTQEIAAPGIAAQPQDDNFVVTLKRKTWTFEAPAESCQWMFVFPGSPAIGSTLAGLQLKQLGVRATDMQRNWQPIALDERLVLQEGDRLLLVGRHSALSRTWEHLRPRT